MKPLYVLAWAFCFLFVTVPEARADSDPAAMLAGYILERTYGRSYETLVERKILQPLGMTATAFKPAPGTMAKGYDGTGREMPGNSEVLAAAGGLKPDIADMLKYADWQLAESDPAVKPSHQHYAESGLHAAALSLVIFHHG